MQRQQRTIEVMVTPAAAMQALTEQYAAVRAADRRAGGGVARLGPRAPAHHTPLPAIYWGAPIEADGALVGSDMAPLEHSPKKPG